MVPTEEFLLCFENGNHMQTKLAFVSVLETWDFTIQVHLLSKTSRYKIAAENSKKLSMVKHFNSTHSNNIVQYIFSELITLTILQKKESEDTKKTAASI